MTPDKEWPDVIFHARNQSVQILYGTRFDAPIEHSWTDGFTFDRLQRAVDGNHLIITNCLSKYPAEYDPYIYTVHPSYYGIYYQPYNVDHTTPVYKNYNCFINRFDPFRQSWFYHLVRRDLLGSGYVSFNAEIPDWAAWDSSYRGLTPQEVFEKGFKEHNRIFQTEHDKIKHQIPFQNFDQTNDLTNLIMTSKFSLILETWWHENNVITFSEKTLRCLQLPRPWIVFSTMGAVEQLRKWNFDVLDDVVDHSYDTVEDPIQRQLLLLDLVTVLSNKLDIPKISARCHEASLHNQSIMAKWHSMFFDQIYKDFDLARVKARKLLNHSENS